MTAIRSKKAAALYLRVSTDEQAKHGTSLAEQEKVTKARAVSDGLEVVEVYKDAGASGTLPLRERPASAQLLNDATLGKFEHVIVAKLDRLSRNTQHLLNDLAALEDLGVTVTIMDVNADTSTDTGKMLLTILGAVATFERERIRARTLGGNIAAAELGRIAPGRLPYGIVSDEDKHLRVNEDEAPAIRLAFQMRTQGASLVDIVRHLNEQTNFKRRQTHDNKATALLRRSDPNAEPVIVQPLWNKGVVANLLSQDAYKGIYRRHLDGRAFTWDVEPIIGEETWDAVQAIPKAPSKVRLSSTPDRHYGLSGRIFHLHDDDSSSKMFGRKLKLKRIYRCYGAQKQDGNPATCSGFGITVGSQVSTKVDADPVEALALLWMLNSLKDPTRWAEYLKAADETLIRQGAAPDDLEAYQEAVAELQAQVDFVETRAITLAGQDGAEEATKWADKNGAPLRAQLANAEAALDRIKSAQTWRDGLSGGLQALMTMDIDKKGDASAGEDDPSQERGSEQWWHLLREQAHAALEPGKHTALSIWAIEETKRLAHLLNLTMTVSERTSWDGMQDGWEKYPLATLPYVTVSFSPQVGLQKGVTSWAVLDLNQ